MKITPLEIRQKTFQKAFRGLDKDDVHAFLISLSQEWESIMEEKRALIAQNQSYEKELEKMKKVENTLYKTLQTAEDAGNSVIEQANKSAELHLKESEIQIDALINEAQTKAKIIIEEAEEQAKNTIEDMHHEVKEIYTQFETLQTHYDNLVQDLESLNQNLHMKIVKSKEQIKSLRVHEILKESKQLIKDQKKMSAFNLPFSKLSNPVTHTAKGNNDAAAHDQKKSSTTQSAPQQPASNKETETEKGSFFDEI